MSKRLTDTKKWRKDWFVNLSVPEKLLWIYVTDNCDHAGICDFSEKIFSFELGFKVTKESLSKILIKKIIWLEYNKFYIVGFTDFQQCKELKPQNRVHASIIKRLDPYMTLISSMLGSNGEEVQLNLDGSTPEPESDKSKGRKIIHKTHIPEEYSEEFEKFWAIWIANPNHRQTDNKSKAWEAWNKHPDRPSLTIISVIAKAYLNTADAKAGCAQMLSTWLNQKGWTMATQTVNSDSKPCPIKDCSKPATHIFGKMQCCEDHFYKLDECLREHKKREPEASVTIYDLFDKLGLEMKNQKRGSNVAG